MAREREVERMLADIRAHTRSSAAMTGRGELHPRVMAAMARVPRERFVPTALSASAYVDGPLPIGRGQTISQPFIVALMSDVIELRPDGRVLEIGTGCGYQTAVLAELAGTVYSVEIIPELQEAALRRIGDLGYDNVQMRVGDGYDGWPEQAPFDAILVTAAARQVPPPLIEQLAPGGLMVIPVGEALFGQDLLLIEKDAAGKATPRSLLPVAFVPLTGNGGQ